MSSETPSNTEATSSPASSSKIKSLDSMNAYVRAMNAEGLTIIEGTATWCSQCKAIAPELDKLAAEFADKGASFFQYDVDRQPDIAQELGVSVMPTFTLFKDGDLLESVSGAKAKALRLAVEKNL